MTDGPKHWIWPIVDSPKCLRAGSPTLCFLLHLGSGLAVLDPSRPVLAGTLARQSAYFREGYTKCIVVERARV